MNRAITPGNRSFVKPRISSLFSLHTYAIVAYIYSSAVSAMRAAPLLCTSLGIGAGK
jgi:hypothetical protein